MNDGPGFIWIKKGLSLVYRSQVDCPQTHTYTLRIHVQPIHINLQTDPTTSTVNSNQQTETDTSTNIKSTCRRLRNTYVNHWDKTSKIVSVEDPDLKGAGRVLKSKVWNAARDTIQEWTGQRLAECSLYGIRIYEEGAVLATHVDRLPLVSSAIINVDQDVDEPWPLEVIGHDGKAYNVTMVRLRDFVLLSRSMQLGHAC